MKNFIFAIVFITTLLLSGCHQDDIILEIHNDNTMSENIKTIKNYIAYKQPTKSRNATTKLCPILYDGDTVAYLANYEEGWELFSNNTDLPMVLMKASKGSFYPGFINSLNPSFNALYDNLIQNLTSLADLT